MDQELKAVGMRLQAMREILGLSASSMAEATGVSLPQYEAMEKGQQDFSFTFLHRAARTLDIDMTELVSGETPHRSGFTVVRQGEGLPIKRRKGFHYMSLAAQFKNRKAEPFLVTAPELSAGAPEAIEMNRHAGQEMDFVLSGSLHIRIDSKDLLLTEGDTIYYDSSRPHGMVAAGGESCQFLAIVIE